MKTRVRIAKFESFYADYNKWISAVKARGADKILAEAPNPNYPSLVYAATKGNLNIVGHWNPEAKSGDAYSAPLFFRSFGRNFKAKWLNKRTKAEEKSSDTVRVKGSKGNIYEVAKDGSNCTCPGFTFRRKCKHTTAMKENGKARN